MNYYKQNLQALKNRIPLFAKMIEEDKGIDWIDEVKAANKTTNIIIRAGNGPVAISSHKNPKLEAIEKAKETDFHNEAATVIFGAGAGYFTRAVLDKMEKRHVVVLVEPVISMLKIAFKLNDFSKEIENGSLLFACTNEDLDYQLSLIEQSKNINQWLIPTETYVKHRPGEYSHLLGHAMMLITQLSNNTGTIIGAGAAMAKNDITNLPYIIKHRGVAELKDIFKDKPAILISTGPSLQKNIHLLMDKNVQDRFIIIAVGQALRVLLSYDIKPDFICSVDFGPVNFGHYKGLLDVKGIPLVTINRTYQPIIKHWEGPKFISVSLDNNTKGTLSEFLTHKGGLLQGGSVSHMTFGLATHMGCNPIIITGQDLALEDDGTSHHALTDEAGTIDFEDNNVVWKVTDPRSGIQGEHNMGPAQTVNGYFGGTVKTISCYISYKSTFERMFKNLPDVTVINATEGGAKLENCQQMTLEEAIEKYALYVDIENDLADPIDKSILIPLLTEVDNGKELVEKTIKLIENDIEELNEIVTSSQRSLTILNRIKGKNTDRKKFTKRIKENYETTIKTKQLADKNPLVALSVFAASKLIAGNRYSNARQEIKDQATKGDKTDINYFYTKEGKEVLKIRVEANEIIMKAANVIAKELLKDYEETLEEMKYMEEHGCLKPFKSINPAPHLDDAETYFKNGNWGHNLIEARRIMQEWDTNTFEDVTDDIINIARRSEILRQEAVEQAKEKYDREGKDKIIKYNHYLDLAYKEGRNQKEGVSKKRDFQKALLYLTKAVEFDPERSEAKWGLATTYHALGDIELEKGNTKEAAAMQDRSITAYKELIEEYPENVQFKFELALVYLLVGFGVDADNLFQEIFSSSEQYDWFLKSLAELYFNTGLIEEAKTAIELYVKKFPFDPRGLKLQEKINV